MVPGFGQPALAHSQAPKVVSVVAMVSLRDPTGIESGTPHLQARFASAVCGSREITQGCTDHVWLRGLVARFFLRVQEVLGSIPRAALVPLITSAAWATDVWHRNVVVRSSGMILI